MASSKRVPMGSKKPPTPKPPAEGKVKPSSVDTARRNRRLGGPAKKGAATPTGSGINDLVYRGPLKMSAQKKRVSSTRPVTKPKPKKKAGGVYGRGML